jgi:twinkle protein
MSEKPVEGDGNPAETPVSKATCENCKKKNSVQVYADGGERCFNKGCGYRKVGTSAPQERPERVATPRGLVRPGEGAFQALSARRINADTLRKYGTFMAGHGGANCLIAPLYSDTGEMVVQIARKPDGTNTNIYTADHEDARTTQLYGRHVYGDRYDRKVVVTSDALDALTGGQVENFKIPVVSITTGADAAAVSVKANYRWLDRFGEIILFFQDGPQWDKAAQECAALFDAGKVKIARLESYSSPNAALVDNHGGDIQSAIWSAATWRPIGIINAKEGLAEILEGGIQVPSWPYPWPVMNDYTLGVRPGEVTYHVGGTGIAKTTILFHYAVAQLMDDGKPFVEFWGKTFPRMDPCKIGWFGFEDGTKSVKLGMLSMHAKRRLHLDPVSNQEAARLYAELFGRGGLELYDPINAEYGLKAIIGYLKYMVRALGCLVVYIDPLTFLVAGLGIANRTQSEDQVAAELAQLARSMGIHIHVAYHLKKADGTPFEEGGEVSIQDIKGSGALYQFSSNVFAYERDQQGTRPDLLRVRSLKLRAVGKTGVIGLLKYDPATGCYQPTEDEWPDKDDEKNNKGGFSQVGGPEKKDY